MPFKQHGRQYDLVVLGATGTPSLPDPIVTWSMRV